MVLCASNRLRKGCGLIVLDASSDSSPVFQGRDRIIYTSVIGITRVLTAALKEKPLTCFEVRRLWVDHRQCLIVITSRILIVTILPHCWNTSCAALSNKPWVRSRLIILPLQFSPWISSGRLPFEEHVGLEGRTQTRHPRSTYRLVRKL